MKKLTIGTIILAAVLILFIFLAASFVLMVLTNVVLNQYSAEPLTISSAMAIVGILSIFGGAIRNNNNDK